MNAPEKRSNVPTLEGVNVLLVVSSYLPNLGGLQSVTSNLAGGLMGRGFAVTLLTHRYPRTLPAAEEIDGVPVRRLFFLSPRLRYLKAGRLDLFLAGIFYFPTNLLRLVRMIRRERPDVVNLHFLGGPAPFLLLARILLRFKYIISLHGDDVEGLARGSWFDRWVFRTSLRRADAVTACSRYLLSQAQAIEAGIAPKGRVIYNGVDLECRPVPGSTCSSILAVGRLMPKKGFDVLLHALASMGRELGAAHLVLIGDGPERDSLRMLGSDLGLNERVEFLGALDHGKAMRAIIGSQIVVIPSRQEPFGLVALEAMAAGKPVVATRVGGLPEVLDGADALLVEPDDPAALAEGIAAAWTRLEREPTFGARNRQVARRFTLEHMIEEYLAAYQTVVGR
jgi:glycogen synthase